MTPVEIAFERAAGGLGISVRRAVSGGFYYADARLAFCAFAAGFAAAHDELDYIEGREHWPRGQHDT